jgi:hypothetical protein
MSTVRQVALPPDARALSTLSRLDYEDAFVVETGRVAQERTGEQWARAMLQDAPMLMRGALPPGWFALGLRLGSPWDERLVLGWEVRRSSPDFALFGARSRLGFLAELLFKRQQDTLLFATFVQEQNAFARALWAGIGPGHRKVVRYLLERVR